MSPGYQRSHQQQRPATGQCAEVSGGLASLRGLPVSGDRGQPHEAEQDQLAVAVPVQLLDQPVGPMQ
jgi:hypothetical protein